jgi:predicted nucleic acid-binding protein
LLDGEALTRARRQFERDFARTHIVELDAATCTLAAQIAESTRLRTLDALHLAALRRVAHDLPLLTFDIRQAQAARSLSLVVVGA